MMTLLALAFGAHAAAPPVDCGAADCAPEIRVVGDQSRVRPTGGGFEVTGLWVLACEGGSRFLAGATAEVDHTPMIGELVGDGLTSRSVACFGESCALPRGTCVSSLARGAYALVDCEAFGPVTDAVIGGTRPQPTAPDGGGWTRVVVDGHTVFATREDDATTMDTAAVDGYADAAPTESWTPAPEPAYDPDAVYAPPVVTSSSSARPEVPTEWTPAERPSDVESGASVSAEPTPYGEPTSYAEPAAEVESWRDPIGGAPEDPIIPGDFNAAPVAAVTPKPEPAPDPAGLTLPPTPEGSCRALSDVVAREARKRVDAGDDRRMANDSQGAFREYRAALTMDPCSANAWVGLGQSALALDRPDLAIRALRAGTGLAPKHYGAWAMLGQAYEAILQRGLAHEAYATALEASPYYPDAVVGEARTR